MKTIEEIIKTIDDDLIEKDREYIGLALSYAKLMSKGIISSSEKSNYVLEKLLEEGKIPHAQQSKQGKKWRIPLSFEGKQRKKFDKIKSSKVQRKKFRFLTLCPKCESNLDFSHEIVNHYYIQCANCNNEFSNPFFKGKKSNIVYRDQIPKFAPFQNQRIPWWADKRNNKYVYWGIAGIIFISIIVSKRNS